MGKEDFITYHKRYLKDVMLGREEIDRQINLDWIRRHEIPSLGELDDAIDAYAEAIENGDEIFILLEQEVLRRSLIKNAREILDSKDSTNKRHRDWSMN